MAAGFPLPRTVYSHGWWLRDDAKMSKSKGNVLDPHVILKTFGPDPLRYFLLREIPIGLDGNFSHEGFLHRVNSDLANDLGNLVHRTLTMIQGYFKGTIEARRRGGGRCRDPQGFEELNPGLSDTSRTTPEPGPRGHLGLHQFGQQISGRKRTVEAGSGRQPEETAGPNSLSDRGGHPGRRFAHLSGHAFKRPKNLGIPGGIQSIAAESFGGFRFDGLAPGRRITGPSLFSQDTLEDFLKDESPQPEPEKKETTMDISPLKNSNGWTSAWGKY